MTIKTQAYLQGYLHEKTAILPKGHDRDTGMIGQEEVWRRARQDPYGFPRGWKTKQDSYKKWRREKTRPMTSEELDAHTFPDNKNRVPWSLGALTGNLPASAMGAFDAWARNRYGVPPDRIIKQYADKKQGAPFIPRSLGEKVRIFESNEQGSRLHGTTPMQWAFPKPLKGLNAKHTLDWSKLVRTLLPDVDVDTGSWREMNAEGVAKGSDIYLNPDSFNDLRRTRRRLSMGARDYYIEHGESPTADQLEHFLNKALEKGFQDYRPDRVLSHELGHVQQYARIPFFSRNLMLILAQLRGFKSVEDEADAAAERWSQGREGDRASWEKTVAAAKALENE